MQQSPAAHPIVEIRKLSFGYDRARPVLRDINLEIPGGSVVGIMGQSGCGKTTLLRVIMGALKPTGGQALVLGQLTSALGSVTTIGGQWFKSGIYTLFGEGYGLGVGATTPTAAAQRLASTATTENANGRRRMCATRC